MSICPFKKLLIEISNVNNIQLDFEQERKTFRIPLFTLKIVTKCIKCRERHIGGKCRRQKYTPKGAHKSLL